MGIIDETIKEIQEQTRACRSDGSAFAEWVDSRDLDGEEVMEVTVREARGLEHHMLTIDPVSLTFAGIVQSAFRWGYETAIKKRARDEERDLGL